MSIPEPIASFSTTITSNISSSDTTIPIDLVTDDDGTSMNSKILFFLMDKGTASEEFIKGTVDAAGSQLTSVTRGISVLDGVTSVAALKFPHRAKASIEITDHPYLALALRAINGTDEIDADARPILDTDQDATDDKEFITQGQLNRTAMGAVTTSNVLAAGTAGATIAAGNLIYFDATANEWLLCDADTATTVNNVLLAIAQGAGTDGNAITGGVLLSGVDDNQSGMTQGDYMYASNTAGGISSSAGTTEVTVGVAKNATELYFAPRFNQNITEAQQDLIDAITASATEINQLAGAVITAAQLNEVAAIVAATDVSGAELETLTNTSNADSLHTHSTENVVIAFREKYKFGEVRLNADNPLDGTQYTIAETESGTATATIADGTGFELTAGGSSGDDAVIRVPGFAKVGNDLLYSETNYLLFQATVAISATTNCRFSWGFSTNVGEANAITDVTVGAYFATDTAGALYAVQAGGATVESSLITGITLATLNTYRIYCDQAANNTYFYVNGVLKATLSDVNDMPDAATAMAGKLGCTATGVGTGVMTILTPVYWNVG